LGKTVEITWTIDWKKVPLKTSPEKLIKYIAGVSGGIIVLVILLVFIDAIYKRRKKGKIIQSKGANQHQPNTISVSNKIFSARHESALYVHLLFFSHVLRSCYYSNLSICISYHTRVPFLWVDIFITISYQQC